jgi:FtsK/SpoIIIE family
MTASRYTTAGRTLDPLELLVSQLLRQPATVAAGAAFAAANQMHASMTTRAVAAGVAGVGTLGTTLWHEHVGAVPQLRRAMTEIGLVFRHEDGTLLTPRCKGWPRHVGRNVHVRWKLPPGVTVTDVLNAKEALEGRCNCELVCWMKDGFLHTEVLRHPIPDHVDFHAFYAGPRPDGRLLVGLGRGRRGALWTNLATLPHLLVGGLTGGGKSVFLRQALTWLALEYPPERMQLVLLDLKRGLELSMFGELPHAVFPVVETVEDAAETLSAVRGELDRRLDLLRSAQVVNADAWAERSGEAWPRLVVVVDEVAELTTGSAKVKARVDPSQIGRACLNSLARLGRAAGVHLILCTQRPDAEAVPGALKANFPGTVAFRVRARVNSEILLDEGGAERLAHHPGRAYWQEDRTEEFQSIYLGHEEAQKLLQEKWGQAPTGRVTPWAQSPVSTPPSPHDGLDESDGDEE